MKVFSTSVAVLLGCALAAAPIVRADAPATSATPAAGSTEEAARRYSRGAEMYNEGNFSGALIEFKKAYELTHVYKVLYNIGQVCYQLQDYVCAIQSFETYLQDGKSELPQARKDEVAGEVKRLKPRIAVVTVQTNVPGVDITVDDIPRGKTPLAPFPVSAGSHRLSAIKEGKIPVSRLIEVAGADSPTIVVELVDSTMTKEVVVSPGESSRFTTLSYVGLVAGGALAVGGAITGIMALSSSSQLKDTRYVGDPSTDAKSLQTRVKGLRLASDVLFGAAILTVGTTLYFTLSRDQAGGEAAPRPNAKSAATDYGARLVIGVGSVGLVGTF
ncbi:MAG: hypothetical protein NVS3B10_13140 [Polyangiales bacterium]